MSPVTASASDADKTSVITAVRDGAAYIARAIESVLAQLHATDELLIVNDRSTDATLAVVASFADPRISVLSAPRPGAAAARNAGLARATGAFIAFLDADDEWLPGRHEPMLAHLAAHPTADAVFGRLRMKHEPGAPDHGYDRVDGQMRPNGVLGTGLFRHAIVRRAGEFAEDMVAAEDIDFFNRLAEAGMRIDAIECDALLYRRHAANMTNDRAFVRRWFTEMLRRKLSRARLRETGAGS